MRDLDKCGGFLGWLSCLKFLHLEEGEFPLVCGWGFLGCSPCRAWAREMYVRHPNLLLQNV